MNKKLKLSVLASFSFALMALLLPAVSNAQGKYTNKYSKRDVSGIITKLENSSDEFAREFDRQMDNSSINGTSQENQFNKIVENYENSLDRLRREFDRNDNWWQSRNNVQDVMRDARPVNQMINNLPFARKLERQWKNMRKDLNKLADTYDLAALDDNDYGNGNGNGGGNVPDWAIGTFYARDPQTGGTITLTISDNGTVNIVFSNGSTGYATVNGTRLYNNGAEARISRTQNGIRTTSVTDGQSIDYSRNSYGNNNGNNNNVGGNVPNWAVGTFQSRNPQTGGIITLTINKNGSVTINMDGNISYATVNGERLYNNGAEAKISKTRNGIRTTSVTDGQSINYTRVN